MSQKTPPLATNEDSLSGFIFALSAYLLWGLLPLYMKALGDIAPLEVIAHRVVWSVPIVLLVVFGIGRTAELRQAMKNKRSLAMAALAAALISINWLIYVWAIGAGYALDAALGYYINPLFSVLVGRFLLNEKLRTGQWVAIALAAAAVAVLTIDAGRLPFVALGLTVTFGIYAYLKKSLPIGPNQGFALEVLILSPFALGYVFWVGAQGEGHFLHGSLRDTLLLFGCGAVTAIPLLAYANGAKGLRLSTIAMLQYVAPTMIMLIAVFLFDEPFGTARAIAFPLIWLALIIFSASMFAGRQRKH